MNQKDIQSRIDRTKNNLIDAASFREPEKIPVGADIYGWAFHYSGVTYEEVLDDPKQCAESFCKVFDEVPMDFVISASVPAPAPIRSSRALGMDKYAFSADRTAVIHNQTSDTFLGPEVYDWIIEDYERFQTEIMPRHLVPAFNLPREKAYEELRQAAIYYKVFDETNQIIYNHLVNELGICQITPSSEEQMNGVFFGAPFDTIFNSYRGIVNAIGDLRRRKSKVSAACDAMNTYTNMYVEYDMEAMKNPWPFGSTYYFSEGFLSPQQFEELYFKPFKDNLLPVLEAGKKMWLLAEGTCMSTLDRFRELPRGSVIIQIDNDDPFDVYEKIGDWCPLATGITIDLLQLGTVEQCRDYVKRCFDTFAPGGGFIFMPNKELICGTDAKRKNVEAVFELANELSRQ